MKTLSIRQPWADLIIRGRKVLELRSWTVKYRGSLAIHASQTVERAACLAHNVDPDQLTTGAIIGVVQLQEIDELDERSYSARRPEHLADDPWQGSPLYGWRFADPQPLAVPVPLRGRMGLFESTIAENGSVSTDSPAHVEQPHRVSKAVRGANDRALPSRTFNLRVQPTGQGGPGEPTYRLALYQYVVTAPAEQQGLYEMEPRSDRRVAELSGPALRAVADHVLDALRSNGYKATDLGVQRREPFALSDESGVRLGLLFLAVRPITRMDRIEVIAQGIRAMTSEEAYYWYSKCTSGPSAERAQKALRVLLAAE